MGNIFFTLVQSNLFH